jgi:hypothetical protein
MFETEDQDVKREICFFFSNMTYLGDPERVFLLFQQRKIVEYYALMIDNKSEVKSIEISLDCLYSIFGAGEKYKQNGENMFIVSMNSIPGVIDRFEQLQYHNSEVIYQKIVRILQKYFKLENCQFS